MRLFVYTLIVSGWSQDIVRAAYNNNHQPVKSCTIASWLASYNYNISIDSIAHVRLNIYAIST